jgi:hypothetical protein
MVCLLSEVSASRKIHQTYLFLQIILQKKLYTNQKHGGQRASNPNSTHHAIDEKRLDEWLGRWDILGIFEQQISPYIIK